MNLTASTSRVAAGVVAAVAGFASYSHIYKVATHAGEHQPVAAVVPLSIDGLILVATLAMLADKRAGRRPRFSARVALVFGTTATVAANVASAAPTTNARLVAVVPAISFLLAVEVLARQGNPIPPDAPGVIESDTAENSESGPVPAPSEIESDSRPEPVPDGVDSDRAQRAAARKSYRQSVTDGRPLSGAALARQYGRPDRWGRDRINEVRKALARATHRAADTPPPADANGAALVAAQ